MKDLELKEFTKGTGKADSKIIDDNYLIRAYRGTDLSKLEAEYSSYIQRF
ncbi:hypothetical protein [Bacillus sp. BP-3]|nr:hypothetical protein [Bacillus sp. BP-3]MDC2865196.1 hypothetical protein [Bacillus sp. BP-3]